MSKIEKLSNPLGNEVLIPISVLNPLPLFDKFMEGSSAETEVIPNSNCGWDNIKESFEILLYENSSNDLANTPWWALLYFMFIPILIPSNVRS